MFDQWDVWPYSDNNNCWDFVRSVLIVEAGLSPECVPKFGICPSDKRSMTNAANTVKSGFTQITTPINHAIACHYLRNTLFHVGIVINGQVRHVSKIGSIRDSIQDFESKMKTEYWIHNELINNL